MTLHGASVGPGPRIAPSRREGPAPVPGLARSPALAVALVLALALAGCDRFTAGSTVDAPELPAPGDGALAALPLGDVAGAAAIAPVVPNPYAGDPRAAAQGHELFVRMNCAGCHGYDAKGGMGPNLTDTYWRYGGVPASIFKSIYEGRPQGMPAWNPALPSQEIWKIVAYLQTLGGSFPAQGYQAALQGDRAGDNLPPGVPATLPPPSASMPGAGEPSRRTPQADARPDAGGKP